MRLLQVWDKKKVCVRWLLHQLKPKMKTAKPKARQWLLAYESEDNDFLYSTVTDDQRWVHH